MVRLGRLLRRAEFKDVYANGTKAAGTYLVLFFRRREGDEVRLGVTATRKFGSAVVRNRARRRVRELFRRHGDALCLGSGDLVVNVRRGCAEVPWRTLEEDYLRCLGRLHARVGSLR